MDTPFVFGKVAIGFDFTDREEEVVTLTTNFMSGINMILISPRRWGKTSLVQKAAAVTARKNKNIKFCFIDLFNVKSEEEFYHTLAQEIIKATSPEWEKRIENTKKFISRFIPKITYSPDPGNEFHLSLDWKEVKKKPDEILNLAQKIAADRKIRIIICIDEFQNISEFKDSLAFQKKLRASWQRHSFVSYCLYGSKRHMMMEVFASSSMPFYKFGHLMFLRKIAEKDWIIFIVKRFSDTRKKISTANAKLIAQLAENHPYYVQQLAQQAWLRSSKVCSEEIILKAFDSLLMQLSLLFQNIVDNLTSMQVNFLHALLDEVEQLSSKDTILQYKLGTSANVLRIKEALVNKEVIDIVEEKIYFLDPMFKSWLKQYYFK